MIGLHITLDADGAWPDLHPALMKERGRTLHHVSNDITVGGLGGGMTSGAPSVMIRLDLPNGDVVLAETSLKLFITAAEALVAKYGDPR